MKATHYLRSTTRLLAAGAGLAAAFYGTYAGMTWYRYGHATPPSSDEDDPLLDRFMPTYEVAERHHVPVAAPGEITFAAACEMDLQESAIIRAIFKGRELILGAHPDDTPRPRGILAQVKSFGWGVLAEVPGREIVLGAVTRPWEPNVTFRALTPANFAGFREPGYVKIIWNLRADPTGPAESIFRTETRAVATDPASRAKFRRYWSVFSPGIVLIRRMMLGPLEQEAARRALKASHGARPTELQEQF